MLSYVSHFLSRSVSTFDDDRWRQASLPMRWGGLGVRGVVLLAPSAFLASAASTMELTSAPLPARLHDVKDSGIDRHRHVTHVCIVTACIMFGYIDNLDATVFNSPTCLGRPMLQDASEHTARSCRSTCRSSSLAGCMFSRFRCLA
jgi:hypothetical protein